MRYLLSGATALFGAVLAFGSTSASAGDYGHAWVRPVMGHHGMSSPGYRPLPSMSYGHAPRVGYGAQGYGAQGYGAPRMVRSGPAVYSMHGASPRFARAPSGYYGQARYAGGAGEGYGHPFHEGHRFHRYGYGLAAATLGAAAGYGYGGGYGYDSGYAQDAASNGYATEGGDDDGAGQAPLTVHYAAQPSYGYGQQVSGGDDVQTNGYASPYNPFQQVGYAGGGGFGLPSVGFGVGIPPAGGLAVYSPGAYGPGPSIIHVPAGYGYGGSTGCTCRAAGY